MYFLHLCYDGVYALRPRSRLWCDFDVVSSGLPPPFPSLRLSPLVASAVSGLRTLFVWFCFFCFCYPRPCASACSHFNRRHSPTLHPVFQLLVPTASVYCYTPLPLVVSRYAPLVVFCGRWRTRTACYPFVPPLLHLQALDASVFHHLLNLVQRIEPTA